ncbi:MAG TPA: hypothetical protein VLS45_03505 [Methylomicrobium sp.]|nr:hypothetical protein [Methylomicrobium sp.]
MEEKKEILAKVHTAASFLALLMIAGFFLSTISVELFGSHDAVAALKALIVIPGLLILIPAIAATGGSGFQLAKLRKGILVAAKKKRMPFIAANGLLILIPCAIVLNHLAAAGSFGTIFYAVQTLELIAGCINIILISMNIRDGLRLNGRLPAANR